MLTLSTFRCQFLLLQEQEAMKCAEESHTGGMTTVRRHKCEERFREKVGLILRSAAPVSENPDVGELESLCFFVTLGIYLKNQKSWK